MKRSIIYLALGFIALGCTNLELVDNNTQRGLFPDEYLAYTDAETQTRVFVNTSLKTLWNADDRITIFNDTYNAQWKFNGQTGSDNGSFSKVSDEYYTAADIPTTYAVYPYNPATSITTEGNITLTLPAVQLYADNSYGLGANTMVAATKTPTSNALYFKSLCSFVVIQLYGSGTVKSITLTGNNGEKLAGTATVTPVYGEAPVATMSDAATTSITLDCGDGVALGSTAATATEFWFCIPPTTFSKGFTIKATNTDGYFMEKVTSSEKVFERNTKYAMAAIEGVFDQCYVPFEDANFKAYCVENFDKDGDGEISMEEAETITIIDVDGGVMKSLKGIEYFTKLEYLDCSLRHSYGSSNNDGKMHWYDSNGNEVFGQLTSLDVSKNTALTFLRCSGNQLTSLDVSKNTALTYLWCYENQLTNLDVSNNTALTELLCHNNQLTSLDVSKNTALTSLACFENQLTSLDVSGCTALTSLACFENQLTSLDVSKNTALTELNCGWNQLTSLDVSKNTALTRLLCYNNQLTSLDVSKNIALTDLYCQNNQLTSLYVSNNTALKYLYCYGNQISTIYVWEGFDPSKLNIEKDDSASFVVKTDYVPFEDANFKAYCVQNFDKDGDGEISMEEAEIITSIDVCTDNIYSAAGIEYFPNLVSLKLNGSGFRSQSNEYATNGKLQHLDLSHSYNLSYLDCHYNDLTDIDVSYCKSLKYLNVYVNQIKDIDVSENKGLVFLDLGKNKLDKVDVANNPLIDTLYVSQNNISLIDVSNNVNMTFFNCDDNNLLTLDVSKNTSLITLSCIRNKLSSIDLGETTALVNLWCYSNKLTNLDVSKNTALTNLGCYNNQLTSLDVSKNTALTELYCYNNQLTSLDVSKNTALTSLRCYDNQLTSLDVSNNTDLTNLFCYSNQLTSLDVSKNTALTNLRCDSNQLTSLDVSKNTALTNLGCDANQLTSLDVSKNTALTTLYCNDNQLTSLDVSKNTALKYLYCENNQLTSLDISKNTALKDLYCYNNQISTIYVWEGFDPSKLIIKKDSSASFVVKTGE